MISEQVSQPLIISQLRYGCSQHALPRLVESFNHTISQGGFVLQTYACKALHRARDAVRAKSNLLNLCSSNQSNSISRSSSTAFTSMMSCDISFSLQGFHSVMEHGSSCMHLHQGTSYIIHHPMVADVEHSHPPPPQVLFCLDEALDPLDHYAVSCKHGDRVTHRNHDVAVSMKLTQVLMLGSKQTYYCLSRSCAADGLVQDWIVGKPADSVFVYIKINHDNIISE